MEPLSDLIELDQARPQMANWPEGCKGRQTVPQARPANQLMEVKTGLTLHDTWGGAGVRPGSTLRESSLP